MNIADRFSHHPPTTPARVTEHVEARECVLSLGLLLDGKLPEGREKALAITKLEECLFWANAAIARQDV